MLGPASKRTCWLLEQPLGEHLPTHRARLAVPVVRLPTAFANGRHHLPVYPTGRLHQQHLGAVCCSRRGQRMRIGTAAAAATEATSAATRRTAAARAASATVGAANLED